ncbi:MAG: tetraacyldisaccharide 4'-kinase [Candidatus Aminicenantales bacterium]
MRVLLRAYSLVSRPVCAWKAARVAAGRKTAQLAPIPVISLGNLTLGGSGKTPLAAELIMHFLARGRHPALVTRGYRGSWERRGGVLSDGRSVFGGPREAGDEPAMIARRFPEAGVFVGRHRYLSCLKAEALGFDLCILDDGFQHLSLARDLDIVLHDPESREPLRESESALARAAILLLPREKNAGSVPGYQHRFPGLKICEYEVAPREIDFGGAAPPAPPDRLKGKRILAFAGIARPDRFFDLLKSLGATVVARLAFPDHYSYPSAGIARISAAVSRHRPEMVLTTEKDAVKLGAVDRTFGGLSLAVLRIGLDLPPDFYARVEAAAAGRNATHA